MRRLATASILALLLATPAIPAAAQEADRPVGLVSDLRDDVQEVREKLVGLARAIPDDAYGWRPGQGVRSVREALLHVAGDNYFLPVAVGTAPPHATGIVSTDPRQMYGEVQAYEGQDLAKDAVVRELEASFDHLQEVMGAESESGLDQTVDLFGQETTRRRLWVLTTTHLHEHLGQLIAYARSNGVVPPWSR